jgi:hypothetical protein
MSAHAVPPLNDAHLSVTQSMPSRSASMPPPSITASRDASIPPARPTRESSQHHILPAQGLETHPAVIVTPPIDLPALLPSDVPSFLPPISSYSPPPSNYHANRQEWDFTLSTIGLYQANLNCPEYEESTSISDFKVDEVDSSPCKLPSNIREVGKTSRAGPQFYGKDEQKIFAIAIKNYELKLAGADFFPGFVDIAAMASEAWRDARKSLKLNIGSTDPILHYVSYFFCSYACSYK